MYVDGQRVIISCVGGQVQTEGSRCNLQLVYKWIVQCLQRAMPPLLIERCASSYIILSYTTFTLLVSTLIRYDFIDMWTFPHYYFGFIIWWRYLPGAYSYQVMIINYRVSDCYTGPVFKYKLWKFTIIITMLEVTNGHSLNSYMTDWHVLSSFFSLQISVCAIPEYPNKYEIRTSRKARAFTN